MMLLIFLLFSISIGALTLFSLKNDGPNKQELKLALSSMYSNFKSLMRSTKEFLLLLVKDIIQSKSTDNSPIESSHRQDEVLISPSTTIQLSDNVDDNLNPSSEEDLALNEFSPDVLQLIEEEEEKVA